jgi:GNAT superfamily N-acetyltransferase
VSQVEAPTFRIEPVDVSDAARLVAWNDVLRRGYGAGRAAAWWRSAEATVSQFQSPKPERHSVALWALASGRPVGAAEAHLDPGEPAEAGIAVIPDRRRQGIGHALAAAVRQALAGQTESIRGETYHPDGIRFAVAHGLSIGNRESRQLLGLPVPARRLAELTQALDGVEIRSWCGSCPEELVDGWARLVGGMVTDVPMGELTRSSTAPNVALVRQNEQRMQAAGYLLVRSTANVDSHLVGYTELFVPTQEPHVLVQDDTFVTHAYRRRGIGRALKLANLRTLMALSEAKTARWVQTYTAVDNTAMLALNTELGFEEADIMTVLEGPLG